MVTFMLLYTEPFSCIYILLNIFEGTDIMGSPGFLSVHSSYGDLPITGIQPTVAREWGMAIEC
jgi:hypothetical protein